MLLASWNVNSITVRLPLVLAWLKKVKPDIFCMQETKIPDDKFPREEFENAGYQCEYFGEPAYNGVAIISRHPIENVQRGFVQEEEPQAKRFIEGTVGQLRVLNAYIPNGQLVGSEKYLYKMRWLGSLSQHLKSRHDPSKPLVLVGDFNIAPEDRDVYKPEEVSGSIMCSENERKSLAHLKEWGFHDVFRKHNSASGEFTWWDYRMGAFRRNMGMRIDHIWATEPAAQACIRAWIDKDPRKEERPSDHVPVMAQFKL